jgi:molybdopterin/thiamine biosynthesis adenylyltransferase
MDPSGLPALSDEETEFYSRQIVLPYIGHEGQLRLRSARVCVAGVGGLGSAAATQLAALGVGHLRLVDYDVVELSNLHRQHLYDVNAIGYPKVEVAASRLHDLNPNVHIEPLPLAIAAHNAEEMVRDMDVVVDGLDSMLPRYAINRACLDLAVPYVFGAAVSMYGNVSTLLPQKTACLECFQGSVDDAVPSCSVLGVHPSIVNLIASIEVAEATRVLLGHEPRLANKLLHCDIEALEFEKVALSRNPSCAACGPEVLTLTTQEHMLVTELCARGGRRVFSIIPPRDLSLDMEQVHALVRQRDFQVTVRAGLGITFQWTPTGKASLLSSGVMIVEGARDEGEACKLFSSLVAGGRRSPKSAAGHQTRQAEHDP